MAHRLATPERVVLLLSLVPYLLEHGETPLEVLAREFEVDVDLMRELVEFLGTAGAPGETNTYQDEDLFDIDWAALEDENLVRLVRAVVIDETPRFSALERAALIAGLHALAPILPESARESALSAVQKLGGMIEPGRGDSARTIQPLSSEAAAHGAVIPLLIDAVDRGAQLDFEYRDLGGRVSSRSVIPLGLVQSEAGWYLRAFCLVRGAERTFVLDGMRAVRESETRAESARPVSPTGPGATDPSVPQSRSDAETPARLRVRESALHRIRGFSPRVLGPAGDGWVRVSVRLAYPGASVRLVQAAPGDVVVDAPASARAAVRAWADRALAQYDA